MIASDQVENRIVFADNNLSVAMENEWDTTVAGADNLHQTSRLEISDGDVSDVTSLDEPTQSAAAAAVNLLADKK